ncbi:UDP-glucose--hexose-1-phosphate uridylyltransferase [Flammeovirga pectinis]|uniref:Galactose-1-phosphate uridylyltransferase n=1 Tax=Flammeovirga pectinis TaxID=2494373 RepID=A0A3Q9FTD2_9BACT|nr:UDP-glucose--hexose-1-phosphate uridylyltransferase [Flammeovirga pectinis]AZQ65540.1 UDP-glucose--hexose-1-phosphate uridylyltransferase [Flammeovirga pectinis]
MEFNFEDHPHRRYNPLTNEWVQVSPHRAKRPWQGQVEKVDEEQRPEHDPNCYLCAGNTRINGEVNPDYKDTFAFQNDFAALLEEIPSGEVNEGNGLFKAKSERGLCKVICFSPRHDLTIPEMDVDGIRKVVDLWCKEYAELGARDYINYVQIFENKGAVMGCSNPHPHGQVWAQESLPLEPEKKQANQLAYFDKNGKTMLSDYIADELKQGTRVVYENEHFVALVPYWAVWPFETMIVPKRAVARVTDLTEEERDALADAYKSLTVKYDNIFQVSFPYSAGIHQAPTDGEDHPEWHMHMTFYPPLLRSATVKKFMVGYEMLANAQRDITAETAAARIREQSLTHYKSTVLEEENR